MKKILNKGFFNRPTLAVARELLGCILCRKIGKRTIRLEITEVEAYDGPRDRASHASRGRTARNAPMFGEAGRWYVYFTYGMHWMLNIVTGPVGYPAAILIRAGICRSQTSTKCRKRHKQRICRCLTSTEFGREIMGPARLTKFLKIDGKFNGRTASRTSGLWIEKGSRVPTHHIQRTPRIGVEYAGKTWSKKPYRFRIAARLF